MTEIKHSHNQLLKKLKYTIIPVVLTFLLRFLDIFSVYDIVKTFIVAASLAKKITDFSEQSSLPISSAVGAYEKLSLCLSFRCLIIMP